MTVGSSKQAANTYLDQSIGLLMVVVEVRLQRRVEREVGWRHREQRRLAIQKWVGSGIWQKWRCGSGIWSGCGG